MFDLNAVHVVTDDVRNVMMSDVSGFMVMRFVVVRFVVVAVDVGVVVGVVLPRVVQFMLHHGFEAGEGKGTSRTNNDVVVFHSRLRIRVQMNAGVGWSHSPFQSRCR